MNPLNAVLQKKAGDIDDSGKHHSNHGQYMDKRLPHRTSNHKSGEEEET